MLYQLIITLVSGMQEQQVIGERAAQIADHQPTDMAPHTVYCTHLHSVLCSQQHHYCPYGALSTGVVFTKTATNLSAARNLHKQTTSHATNHQTCN